MYFAAFCGLFYSESSAGFPDLSCKDFRSDVIFDDSENVHSGSRDGAVVRALASHQCGLGSTPGPSVIWVEFVVGSQSLLQGFFSGFSDSPSCTKRKRFKF